MAILPCHQTKRTANAQMETPYQPSRWIPLMRGTVDVLRDKLPDANPFKERMRSLTVLTMFATTYRYPNDAGRLPTPPSAEETRAWARETRPSAD